MAHEKDLVNECEKIPMLYALMLVILVLQYLCNLHYTHIPVL